MDLFIITPSIKKLRRLPTAFSREHSTVVLLTNPLAQDPFKKLFPSGVTFITDDDIIPTDTALGELVEIAKSFAWNWFKQDGLGQDLNYRGIDLRCLFTQDLILYLVKAVKIIALYKAIITQRSINRITLLDDGSAWGSIASRMAKSFDITIYRYRKTARPPVGWKHILASQLKSIFNAINRFQNPSWKKNGVLISSALKFATPFFEKGVPGYYLREVFSYDAWKLARRSLFNHILPDYFSSRSTNTAVPINRAASAIDNFFRGHSFFTLNGTNVWPWISTDFDRMLREYARRAMALIDRLEPLLARLQPRAVFVDEEVCFFNKTLIRVARARNIPTFCFVHGFPLESVGSIPSSVDKIFAWGKSTKRQLEKWGIAENRILETGAPQLKVDSQINSFVTRASVLDNLRFSKNSRYILLTAFPFDTNENPTFTRTSTGIKIQNHALDIAFALLEQCPDLNLVIKFHPHEKHVAFSRGRMTDLNRGILPRVRFLCQYSTSDLISGSEIVLTVASTVYFEALLMRKPVFLLDLKARLWGDVMSRDFLNIENPKSCVKTVIACLAIHVKNQRLRAQDSEIQDHFYQGNQQPVATILNWIKNQ